MNTRVKEYLKKIRNRKVYKLTPYGRIRRHTRKSKHRQADSEYGQDNNNNGSNDHPNEFLEDEIQDLVSAVQTKIDSLDRKCCDERDDFDWRTGCHSCGPHAARYFGCKLDFRKGNKHSSRWTKRKREKACYSPYHEDLRDDDSDHFWRLRLCFSLVKSCMNDYIEDGFRVDILVPRAYHLIRILQLLSLPRCKIKSVPQEIVNTLSTALTGPYRQVDNRNSMQSSLRVIEIDNIDITLPAMQLLHNVLVSSESLEQLHLNEWLSPDSTEDQFPFVEVLGDGLANAKSTQFKVLGVSKWYLTDANVAYLISQVAAPSQQRYQLETLILKGNCFAQETLTTLASWLEQPNCSLRALDLSSCSDPSAHEHQSLDLSPLSRALKVQITMQQKQLGGGLRSLNVGFDTLSDEGVRLLADALKQEQPLQVPLAVNSHTSDVNGLKSLTLHTIRTGQCQTVTYRGLQYLGEALPFCYSVQHLDVSYARFDPAALDAFCTGLADNHSITVLQIRRLRFTGFPEIGEGTSADWISTWGGTQLPQHDSIPSSSPTTAMEYLCKVLVTAMPQLNLLDISYAVGLPTYFYGNLFQMKELEQLSLLGYDDFMTRSGISDECYDQALIWGVAKSTNIVKIYGLDEAHCRTEVDFYVRLNKGGRKHLRQGISSSLWPLILERSNQQPDVLHHLLRDGAVSVL